MWYVDRSNQSPQWQKISVPHRRQRSLHDSALSEDNAASRQDSRVGFIALGGAAFRIDRVNARYYSPLTHLSAHLSAAHTRSHSWRSILFSTLSRYNSRTSPAGSHTVSSSWIYRRKGFGSALMLSAVGIQFGGMSMRGVGYPSLSVVI